MLITILLLSCQLEAAFVHHADFSQDRFKVRIELGAIGFPGPLVEGVLWGPDASMLALRNEFWEGSVSHYVGHGGYHKILMLVTHLVPSGAESWGLIFDLSTEQNKYIKGFLPITWSTIGKGAVLHPEKYRDIYNWHYIETIPTGGFGGGPGASQDKFLTLEGRHVPEPPLIVMFIFGLIVLLYSREIFRDGP